MEVKKNLSKNDKTYFEAFRKQYPGWDIVRYVDNSLGFVSPVKESFKHKLRITKK